MDNDKLEKAKKLREKLSLLREEIKRFDTSINFKDTRITLWDRIKACYIEVFRRKERYLNDESIEKIVLLNEVFVNALNSVLVQELKRLESEFEAL